MTDIAEVKTRTDLVQLTGRYMTLRPSGRAFAPSARFTRNARRHSTFGAKASRGAASAPAPPAATPMTF